LGLLPKSRFFSVLNVTNACDRHVLKMTSLFLYSCLATLFDKQSLKEGFAMSDRGAQQAAQVTMGALTELARRGGQNFANPRGVGAAGAALVSGAAYVAPAAVAQVSAATAAALAGSATLAAVAAPIAAVAAVGFGVYWLVKQFD
jgi:hypothetical protein